MFKCWAETYCNLYNEEQSNCSEHCIGYVQLSNIYKLSNMPKRYQYEMTLYPDEVDLEAFRYMKKFKENSYQNIQQGKGLFIVSKVKGNGKTAWACKIMNDYFRQVALTNNLSCRGLFVSVPDFLNNMKRAFNDEDERKKMDKFTEDIKKADLVIWDDIGTESPTKWVREQLYIYINHRESNGKAQIFTSNETLETMKDESMLGEKIVSRILGQCEMITLKGESRREQK